MSTELCLNHALQKFYCFSLNLPSFVSLPFQSNAVNAVPLSEEAQRVVTNAVTPPRKSETDSLLMGQFSTSETRPNELTVVSPSMISRTLPSDIGATIVQRKFDEELRAPTQAQQITANSVEVITIDENIEEARNIQEMKDSTVEEHVAKKLKYMEH